MTTSPFTLPPPWRHVTECAVERYRCSAGHDDWTYALVVAHLLALAAAATYVRPNSDGSHVYEHPDEPALLFAARGGALTTVLDRNMRAGRSGRVLAQRVR